MQWKTTELVNFTATPAERIVCIVFFKSVSHLLFRADKKQTKKIFQLIQSDRLLCFFNHFVTCKAFIIYSIIKLLPWHYRILDSGWSRTWWIIFYNSRSDNSAATNHRFILMHLLPYVLVPMVSCSPGFYCFCVRGILNEDFLTAMALEW